MTIHSIKLVLPGFQILEYQLVTINIVCVCMDVCVRACIRTCMHTCVCVCGGWISVDKFKFIIAITSRPSVLSFHIITK